MIFNPNSFWLCGLAVALLTGAASATDHDDQVHQWLDRLEQRGQQIETFTAAISYLREDELTGDRQTRTGRVWYAAAEPDDDEPARFAVHFDQLVVDGALRRQDRHFIFDGEWLVEKEADRRIFQKRQVVRPGQTFDPLRVDGPFPLPIGQKREEVLARFNVALVEPEEADEENLVHLRLTPRDDVPRRRGEAEFDVIEIWFDRERLLPERVETREGHNRTVVALHGLAVDEADRQELAERFDVEPPPPGSGWRVEVTTFDEQE